jgi:serine/threonine protein kinase
MAMGSKMAPAAPGAELYGDEALTAADPSSPSHTSPLVSASLPVARGEMVGGKYRIERAIGKGGMGVVVAAHDVGLDRPVAIKFLHRLTATDQEFSARFRREARAMAKLTNDHCVRVLDVGELPTGEPFLVMEQLEGRDLSALVDKHGPLPVSDVADYVLQACEAIAEAHSLGIVHRDLKPSNLYLARKADGTSTIKVLDFGIAKMTTEDSESPQSLTNTTAFLGSPAYISPEQLLCARDVGPQADIWSLGAIMHKLLAGRPPFIADTMPQVCSLIISSPPARVRDVRPEVPRELQDIILRCLQREPRDRFRSVADLARALAPFAPAGSYPSADRATWMMRALTITVPERSRRVKAGAAIAAVGVVVALLVFLGVRRSPSAAAVPPPPVTVAAQPAPLAIDPSAPAPSVPPPSAAPALPSTAAASSPPASPRGIPAAATTHRAPPARPPKRDNSEFGGRK